MLPLLKEYVERNKIGFHYEPNFVGFLNFTKEVGRIVLCNKPNASSSYYRPSSITFWVQHAGSIDILATWNGRYYLTQDESVLVEVADGLFNDKTSSNAPYGVPERFLANRPIYEFSTLALLKKKILQKHSLTESNIQEWYCMSDRDDDWLDVPNQKILKFLENYCEFSIDEYSWCRFSCKGVSGFLRLSSDKPKDGFLEIAVLNQNDEDEDKEFVELVNDFFGGLLV